MGFREQPKKILFSGCSNLNGNTSASANPAVRKPLAHQGAGPCTLHAHYAHYAHFSKLARPPKIKL